MKLFEIKHHVSGAVLFSLECESMRVCMEVGVRKNTNLTGANLRGADLTDADLWSANLTDADLTGANLTGANLTGADLTDADLTGASLRGANLSGAYLEGANLTDAYLTGAYLGDADLTGANLTNVNAIIPLGCPNGWASAFAYMHDNILRVQVGCRNFTLSEGREYWADKPHRREVLAALDYVETVANIREWK